MRDQLEGGAPASAARPADVSGIADLNERRIALDDKAYTCEEFVAHYGFVRGLAVWQAHSPDGAERPALNLNERRISLYGQAYTLEEFVTHYGFTNGLALWQESECQAGAEEPLGPAVSHSTDSAAQPADIITSNDDFTFTNVRAFWQTKDSRPSAQEPVGPAAEQPASIPANHAEENVQQPVGTTARYTGSSAEHPAATTSSHTTGQDILLSWDELMAMTTHKKCGGKAANKEQRLLREYCKDSLGVFRQWEIDLSDSTYDWKHLLKAMPHTKSQPLVGAGVVKFSFRLLQNVLDHNYVKIDSGERHIFEILCADGERWQLHFHKNGNMDNPFRIPPTSSMPHDRPVSNASCSAGQPVNQEGPTWHLHDILNSTAEHNLPVGRNEVHMALVTILNKFSPQESPFAVDITATAVLPWHRWLRNTVSNKELIGSGIVKVFALCETSINKPQIVFCHPDDTYTCAKPEKRLEYQRRSGWRDCIPFAQASVETVSWMQTRQCSQ